MIKLDHITIRAPKNTTSGLQSQIDKNKTDITTINGNIANINNELADKATTQYVDDAIANIPGVDLTTINDKITALETKDTDLENTINNDVKPQLDLIDDLANANKTDLDNYKPKVDALETALPTKLDKTIWDAFIVQVENSHIFSWAGEYQAGTTYKAQQVVYSGDKVYISLVDNNTADLTDTNSWMVLETPFNVDLTDYYTKAESDTKLNEYIKKDNGASNVVEVIGTLNFNQNCRFKENAYCSNAPTHNEHYVNKEYADKAAKKDVENVMTNNGRFYYDGDRDNETALHKLNGDPISANKRIDLFHIHDGGYKWGMEWYKDKPDFVEWKGKNLFKQAFFIGQENKHWFFQNFNYGGKNFTAMKVVDGTDNKFQFEYNHDDRTLSMGAQNVALFEIKGLTAPISDTHAANKKYVDDAIANIQTGSSNPLLTHTLLSNTINGTVITLADSVLTNDIATNYKYGKVSLVAKNDATNINVVPIIGILKGAGSYIVSTVFDFDTITKDDYNITLTIY